MVFFVNKNKKQVNTYLLFELCELKQSPMEMHCSQTYGNLCAESDLFESPMEMHCSQTVIVHLCGIEVFESPMEMHCSQTQLGHNVSIPGLSPLWKCTALKLYA